LLFYNHASLGLEEHVMATPIPASEGAAKHAPVKITIAISIILVLIVSPASKQIFENFTGCERMLQMAPREAAIAVSKGLAIVATIGAQSRSGMGIIAAHYGHQEVIASEIPQRLRLMCHNVHTRQRNQRRLS
jgi:hypothetical protein